MTTDTAIRISRPVKPLELADRERLADSLAAAGATPVVYARVTAPWGEYPRPELDLVIQADWRRSRSIRQAWIDWSLEQDLDIDGEIEVELRYTYALPQGRVRRQKESVSALRVDLAQVLLERDLAELDAADRALGLCLYGGPPC